MIRISLGAIGALAMAAVVGVAALVAQPADVEAQAPTASRAFQQTWAAPGSEVRVTITADSYGVFGQVVETLPEGFALVSASLEEDQVLAEGQTVRFSLLGETNFTYVVSVPATEGQYTFTGVIKNADREERTITGHRELRVGPPPTPTPTATPTPTSTPTPEPTATPTPEPTATPPPSSTATPEPTATPTPEPTATLTPTPTPVPEPTPTPEPPPTPEPTTMPAPTTTPPSTATATPPEADDNNPPWVWVLSAIAFLLLVGVVALFMLRHRSG